MKPSPVSGSRRCSEGRRYSLICWMRVASTTLYLRRESTTNSCARYTIPLPAEALYHLGPLCPKILLLMRIFGQGCKAGRCRRSLVVRACRGHSAFIRSCTPMTVPTVCLHQNDVEPAGGLGPEGAPAGTSPLSM